ncbi:hypothetical protein HYQ46_011831 [Verticillium longisporum]|nr:hypothetical protein HYQ46_011831 [Verticillium longisporum]
MIPIVVGQILGKVLARHSESKTLLSRFALRIINLHCFTIPCCRSKYKSISNLGEETDDVLLLLGLRFDKADVSLQHNAVVLPVERCNESADCERSLGSEAVIIGTFGSTKDEVLQNRDEEVVKVWTAELVDFVSSD